MRARSSAHFLRTLFRLEPGEGFRAGLMLLYSIAAVGGVIITGQLVSRALFLSSLPASAIPYKFILPPLALMATTALYARVTSHLRRDHLILGSCGLILLGALAFRLLLATGHRHDFGLLCGLFVFFDVAGDLVILQFWTFAHDLFNPREAKRLFGLIAGGSTVANVLFGAFLGTIAASLDPRNLIFLMAASLLVCMGCVWGLGRRHGSLVVATQGGADSQPGSGALLADARELLRRPLLLSMGGILVLIALASSIADYQLDLGLQSTYGQNSQEMVGFLGRFRFWSGLAAGVLQFFLAGRLLERFGLGPALLLLPCGMALGSGAILLSGGVLWAAAMPRACDVVLKYTVNDAAFNLLYLPTPARLRARAKAILDGFLRPPLVSLLGVVFLLVSHRGHAGLLAWSWPLLALVVVWIGLVLAVVRQYVGALAASVQLRRLDLDRETFDLADDSSVRVLRQTLASPDPLLVIHALELLPRLPGIDFTSQVAGLLEHASPQVRALALEHLGQQEARACAPLVAQKLCDPEEEVREAALACLAALQGLAALPLVLPFLQDPVPRLRAAAVLGLLRHGGLDGWLHAAEPFKALLVSPDPRARLAGAQVLGGLQVPGFYHPLVELLADPVPQVRVAALRAASQVCAPQLVPCLLEQLRHPLLRWHAAQALAQCLGPDLSSVDAALEDQEQPLAVRRQLIQVLRQQRSEPAVARLAALVHSPETPLRAAAGQALLELRRSGYPLVLDPERLHQALRAEAESAYGQHLARQELALAPAEQLLDEALRVRLQQARDRLLDLLGLRYLRLSTASLRASLAHPDARRQATALELIDNVAERRDKDLLLPLLGSSAEERRAAARRLFGLEPCTAEDYLAALAHHPDPYLRSCALHACGGRRLARLDALVAQALDDSHPLVRETAQLARRLAGRAPASAPEGEHLMALSTLEKVLFFKSVPLFEEIPGEDVLGMVPILREVEFPAGQTFITRGEEGDCLYILVEGEVGVQVEGRQRPSLRPREVIGELAVLSEQPRTADCTALTDVVALRIDKEDFWQILREQPQIAVQVMRRIVQRYL